MQLKEVRTLEANPAQGHRTVSCNLIAGENGVLSLTKNDDLTIWVEGETESFLLYPANVVRAKPLESSLLLRVSSPMASSPTSTEPQSGGSSAAEPSAVNRDVDSSNLSPGANSTSSISVDAGPSDDAAQTRGPGAQEQVSGTSSQTTNQNRFNKRRSKSK